MGNGFMSRPSSAESMWGRVEERKDEDLYQPIRNYAGEIVAWKERSESEKLRRRMLRREFAPEESDTDEETSYPAPAQKKPVKIVIDELNESEEEDVAFNRSLDRAPSAKSVSVTPQPQTKSRSRVKDKFKPSLVANTSFNKDSAADKLYQALHDSPHDHDTIIDVLTSHSHDQRKKISKTYKFQHNKNLRSDLEHNLRGDLRKLMVGLILDEGEYFAEALRSQIDGSFSINDVVGMLAWRDADTLDEINKIYSARYNSDLEEDLLESSDSKYHPVIQVIMSENRDDEEDWSQVEKSVKVLARAVEEHDKEAFKLNLNYVLCCRSWEILPDILDKFETMTEGKDLSHYMKRMLGKKTGEAFMPLLYVLDEPSAFYAEEIFDSVEGVGTNDEKLQRIFITRSEVDLVSIDHVFKKMFDKKLEKIVKEETSGHYKDALLSLLTSHLRS